MYTLILPDPFAPPTAPAEDDVDAAQPETSAAKALENVPSVVSPSDVEAEGSSAGGLAVEASPTEASVEANRAADGVTDLSAPSPAKENDLEVEALVQADAELPSGSLDSPMPVSPLPATFDLPASPPAPHRPLPPAFPKAQLVGLTVFYPVQLSNRVPVAQLKRQRWTDASNKFDEECGEEEMDWSDDEAEAAAKRRKKLRCVGSGTLSYSHLPLTSLSLPTRSRGSKAGSVRGGSPTPSMGSQWGGSHFDANSDDEGTVLNYSAVAEMAGAASLPKRPMPVAYDDLDASEYRGESSNGGANGATRGGKQRERGGAARGKGKDRANDGLSSRGGFESSRGGGGRGGARGGVRGGFDAGRGIARPRGRGGAMGSPHNPHSSYESQQQQQQPRSVPAAPPPPARPLSPTSMAIARATGQYPSGGQAPPGAAGPGPPQGMPFPVRPYFPQAGFPYPSPYGQPMGPYGQLPPGGQQTQQPQQQSQQQQQHAFGGPAPGSHMPYGQPPYGYPGIYGVPHGQMAPGQPQHNPALQQALQQQQAEHNKQLLEMQRQIALLSRKQAGGAATPGGAGPGEAQQ